MGRVKKAEKKEICGLNEKYIYSKLLHTLQETFDGKLDALTFILRLDGLNFDSKRKIDSNTSCRRFYRKRKLTYCLVIRGKCDFSEPCILIGWKSYTLCSKCFGFNCCFSDWLKMGQNGSIWLLKICRRNRDLEHLGSKNTCRRRNRDSKTPITKERVLFCM